MSLFPAARSEPLLFFFSVPESSVLTSKLLEHVVSEQKGDYLIYK